MNHRRGTKPKDKIKRSSGSSANIFLVTAKCSSLHFLLTTFTMLRLTGRDGFKYIFPDIISQHWNSRKALMEIISRAKFCVCTRFICLCLAYSEMATISRLPRMIRLLMRTFCTVEARKWHSLKTQFFFKNCMIGILI